MRSAPWKFVAVLAAALVVGGCAAKASKSTDTPAAATPTPAGATPSSSAGCSPASALFLVGQPDHTSAAARLLRDFETRLNATPGPNDTVLFTVSVVDGPMPQTRTQIEALRGKDFGPAAILLVGNDASTDPELRELVLTETRELLVTNSVPDAADLPVINAEDPNLDLLVRGVAASC